MVELMGLFAENMTNSKTNKQKNVHLIALLNAAMGKISKKKQVEELLKSLLYNNFLMNDVDRR